MGAQTLGKGLVISDGVVVAQANLGQQGPRKLSKCSGGWVCRIDYQPGYRLHYDTSKREGSG